MKVLKWIGFILLGIVGLGLIVVVTFQALKWGSWPWQLGTLHPDKLPTFVAHDYLDLHQVEAISKFRSGIGHDAHDSFETCRSMKHYFMYNQDIQDRTTIKIYSPVNGTIMFTIPDGQDKQIWIRPDNYPQYSIRIYHTKPLPGVSRGTKVTAGQHIAYHSRNNTNSDIQVGITGLWRNRFVSYFEVMADEVFAEYQKLGFKDRSDFIISKEARDADPLACRFGFGGTGLFKTERPNEVVRLRPAGQPAGQIPAQAQQQTQFITANPIKLGQISAISKFRSCVGHNYSGYNVQGELEAANRSMKHYLKVKDPKPEVFAPFDGTIIKVEAERAAYGKQVHLVSPAHPWIFIFFHVDLNPDLTVNSAVTAGQQLGRAGTKVANDSFDFTLVKYENDQPTYESPFNWMAPPVLGEYVARGVTKEALVVPKAERDAAPCRFGSQSLDPSNWINVR